MMCQKCGANIPNGSSFCTICGYNQNRKNSSGREKKTEEDFKRDAEKICLEYNFFGDGKCTAPVKKYREAYRERESRFPKKPSIFQASAREKYNDLTKQMDKYRKEADDERQRRLDKLCEEYKNDLEMSRMKSKLLVIELDVYIRGLNLPEIDDDEV